MAAMFYMKAEILKAKACIQPYDRPFTEDEAKELME